jgi:hypothetical protein
VVNDAKGSDYSYGNGDHDNVCLKLGGAARLATWATPKQNDATRGPAQMDGRRSNLGDQAASSESTIAPSPTTNHTPTTSPSIAPWATPLATSSRGQPDMDAWIERKQRSRPGSTAITELNMQAQIAGTPVQPTGWCTPLATDGEKAATAFGRGNPTLLRQARSMEEASWATPVATELGNTLESYVELGNTLEGYVAMKANMTSGPRTAITHPSLQAQLVMTNWPTTTARDGKGGDHTLEEHDQWRDGGADLPTIAKMSGMTSSGSPASTAKRGQLNPDLSRWLMGYPVAWLFAAPSNKATPRTKKKTSTRASSRPRKARSSSTGTTALALSPDSATPSSPKSPPRSSSRRSKRRKSSSEPEAT